MAKMYHFFVEHIHEGAVGILLNAYTTEQRAPMPTATTFRRKWAKGRLKWAVIVSADK